MARRGIMIAGLSSGSGKTLICLGLMRTMRKRGIDIAAAKAGPDYIDPGFHTAALGKASVNLDPFAMPAGLIRSLAAHRGGDVLIAEGVMGVHDGGAASSARLAAMLDMPVVLVMDVRGQCETAAAIARGMKASLAAEGVRLAGVILNHCRSPRHEGLVKSAISPHGIAVFGAMPEADDLAVPSRHLGLVQAGDVPGLEALVEAVADRVAENIDLDGVLAAATPLAAPRASGSSDGRGREAMPPPHSHIAIARDAAFGFAYPHLLEGWERGGARLDFFSPLNDEVPAGGCGFIFLPGGYPELHLEALSKGRRFFESLRDAAASGVAIYGECGGYMVLGKALTDGKGRRAEMAGLLGLETSFMNPRRHLGYRMMRRVGDMPIPAVAYGHEFHYTTAVREEGTPLFMAEDKDGHDLGACGLVAGGVAGSYLHLIAAA